MKDLGLSNGSVAYAFGIMTLTMLIILSNIELACFLSTNNPVRLFLFFVLCYLLLCLQENVATAGNVKFAIFRESF